MIIIIFHPYSNYYRSFLAPEARNRLSWPPHPVHEDLPDCGCGQCNFTHAIALRAPCPTWMAIADMQQTDMIKSQNSGIAHSMGTLRAPFCFLLQILIATTGRALLQISCSRRRFPGILARWFTRQVYSADPNEDDWQCSYLNPSSKQERSNVLCPLDYTSLILEFFPDIWQKRISELTIRLVWHKKLPCSYCHGQMEAFPITLPMPMPCCQLCGDRPADHHPCCCPLLIKSWSLWSSKRYWSADKMYSGDVELLLRQILLPHEQLKGPTTLSDLDRLYRGGHCLLPIKE